jgi:hypothetical protein
MPSLLVFNRVCRLEIHGGIFDPALRTIALYPNLWITLPPLPSIYCTDSVGLGRDWGGGRGGGVELF